MKLILALVIYWAGVMTAPGLESYITHVDGVYFTKYGAKPDQAVIGVMDSAEHSLDIAIYALTKDDIVQAIRRAKARGVRVRVITDFGQTQGKAQNAAIRALIQDGIPVKVNSHDGLMHLKLTIADGSRAAVGSFNYSKAASTVNDEVVVLLSDEGAVRQMADTFERMWNDERHFRSFQP
ncbi:MAG: phospholipase D family protein [Hydrogenibacillus sp.]|nr:phospholipase D family protein [Hydrogenibacillus sp.]